MCWRLHRVCTRSRFHRAGCLGTVLRCLPLQALPTRALVTPPCCPCCLSRRLQLPLQRQNLQTLSRSWGMFENHVCAPSIDPEHLRQTCHAWQWVQARDVASGHMAWGTLGGLCTHPSRGRLSIKFFRLARGEAAEARLPVPSRHSAFPSSWE